MTAGAVLVSALAIPGTAHAEAPVVKAAGSSGDWAAIEVRLRHGSAIGEDITKITATLRPAGSGESDAPVATVTDFKQANWISPWEGVWSSQPVHLDTLGDYTIDVEATTSAGETTVRKDAGTLRYRKQPVFQDFAVTPTTPTIEDKTVTVSGDLVVRDPITRLTEPLPGASVSLWIERQIETPATTDDKGHFSFSHELTEGGGAYATYRGDLGYASTFWVDITPTAAPTRITLDKSSFHLTAGDKITVSGTLQYQSGSEWKPLSGIPLEMDYKNSSTSHPIEATTGADGRFSFAASPYQKTVYEVAFRPYPYNAWIQRTATVDVDVAVTATTKFRGFTASLDKYAELSVSGTLGIVGEDHSERVSVAIQYSPNGRTGWTTEKTVKTDFDSQFHTTLPGYTDGYWRLKYAGSTTYDVVGTTSGALRKNRALTRIRNADASPEPVRKGRTITVKGVLQERQAGSSTWKAYGSRKVQILFRPTGKKTWYLMTTVTSKSNGSFSKGFTARQDGTWVPVFLYPDRGHFVGSGKEDYVDVR
ncbi:hypothetical protein [Streptomyces neyagawaensis]|uniref:hypothetical protein n=1 Tax=Streptomyces neyagawaensis TaxID=42238 RepID=UPI0006E1C5EF|nr:hypothetical protein [Streptomyces neyagawaensis]MCL6738083.1 hypothetical protein [Streptomyces neyagawaensis]MDE1681785.1 hypothetical protein [Streptomyces neyagawaensis]